MISRREVTVGVSNPNPFGIPLGVKLKRNLVKKKNYANAVLLFNTLIGEKIVKCK